MTQATPKRERVELAVGQVWRRHRGGDAVRVWGIDSDVNEQGGDGRIRRARVGRVPLLRRGSTDMSVCEYCDGRGFREGLTDLLRDDRGSVQSWEREECSMCDGTGIYPPPDDEPPTTGNPTPEAPTDA